MNLHKMIPVRSLQLFADGGAAGGSGAAAAGTGVNASAAGVQTGVNTNQNAAAATDGAPDAGVKADPKPDREAKFKELITGEYKDLYDAHVQGIVKNRLKGPTAEAQKYKSLEPTVDLLFKHYGVDTLEALAKAVEGDDHIIEQMAMEQNMSPDEFRKFRSLEMQNAALQRQVAERQQADAAAQIYQRWKGQAEDARRLYPSLDLDAELANPVFRDLLRSPNISIQTAYEVIHKDEIAAGLLRHATEEAARQVAANVAANGARPNENGMGAQGAASVKMDPAKMTKAQRRELNRRAAMGEKISF